MIKSIIQTSLCSLMRMKVSPVETLSKLSCVNLTTARDFHITSISDIEFRVGQVKVRARDHDKRELLEGEVSLDVQAADQSPVHPDESTPDCVFNGVLYKHLPIINIKSTQNNTILTTTDYKGLVILLHSAGMEGFKNAKKGTNIAAQQAAVTLGERTIERGIKTVRVRVQGIGAGRMAAIKGIQLAGLEIVSVTDDTRVSWHPPRPKKQRRI